MRVSVIIPTYRRAESLERCLDGMKSQVRTPDEVCVIALPGDEDTLRVLQAWSGWSPLRIVTSLLGGQVNQLNAGLGAIEGDIVCITDDDAVPRADWLLRIEQHFAEDASLGGVGGRDFVHEGGVLLDGDAKTIGVVRWFGRVVGNHHIGVALRRDIDILKGANMSYRVAAIEGERFDTALRGRGAQTCNDMAFSLAVRRRGWGLLFDPEVAVDHYPARRPDVDPRTAPSLAAIEDSCFNFYLALRRHMRHGLRRHMALAWARTVGVRRAPGSLRGVLSRVRGDVEGVAMRRAAERAWVCAREICSIES